MMLRYLLVESYQVRRCVYIRVLWKICMPLTSGCAKPLKEISPPIVYVVTMVLGSLKGQLICGSWLSVAVIS